jgi:hypothetical protein
MVQMFTDHADEALQIAKSEPDDLEIMAILYKYYKPDLSMNMKTKERSK